jgi:signal transduction histidine kinase
MGYPSDVTRGFQLPSGRVIALGRLLMASLFLLAIRIDVTQPAHSSRELYALLAGYLFFAAVMVAATWRNWWLDAKLAGPAHAVDIATFTIIVFITEGYTSPFFIFFVFLLLAAAIRWGWRETALTAILVTLLYLIAEIVAARLGGARFEVFRFLVRSGDLIILSLIIMWFGINRWDVRFSSRADEILANAPTDEPPIETSLRAALVKLNARSGVFVWRKSGFKEARACAIRREAVKMGTLKKPPKLPDGGPILYQVEKQRALTRNSDHGLTAQMLNEVIPPQTAQLLHLSEGVAIPIRTETGDGALFLESMRDLSTDDIALAEQVAIDVAAHIHRSAVVRAAEESAEARSRLSLARDLHDSVVQFLAGAAFRLEAMKRSEASGRDLEPELNELKKLMLQEQGELRSFIGALRRGSQVAFNDLARDLEALAERLSRQWDVRCAFSAQECKIMIPTKIHIDAQQLVREAVANAVRHAGAKSVEIALDAVSGRLRLDLINDGAAYPDAGGRMELPDSIRERVEQAGGALELSRGMQVTKVSISLPIAARAA